MRRSLDAGFTLVELLVSISILGIIAPTMAGAIVLGLKVTTATTAQLAASHNRQQSAAFFTSDVQPAVTIADATSPDTTTCMSAGQTLVGRLSWTDIDFTGTSTARVVTYVSAVVSGESQLIRQSCVAGVMSSVIVVHGLTSATLACTSTSFAAASCATAAGAKLILADLAGSWVLEGLER